MKIRNVLDHDQIGIAEQLIGAPEPVEPSAIAGQSGAGSSFGAKAIPCMPQERRLPHTSILSWSFSMKLRSAAVAFGLPAQ